MSPVNLISDLVAVMEAAGPLPDIHDRAAVKAAVLKALPALIDLIYDAGGIDAVKTALAAAAPGDLEKIGDGHIIKWLVANLPTIISTIEAIIAVIPK